MAKGSPSKVNVEITQEAYNIATKRLKDLAEDWTSGVCEGDCLDIDGSSFQCWRHTACHSWVSSAFGHYGRKNTPSGNNFLILNCHTKKRSKHICSAEANEGIIKWIARESVFSEHVVNRDDDESLLNHGIILLCGKDGLSHNEALWICKVLRHAQEGDKALETWLTLYNGGVNPYLAVFIMSLVRTRNGATFGFTGTQDHCGVFGSSYYGRQEYDLKALLDPTPNKKASATDYVLVPKEDSVKTLAKGQKITVQQIRSLFKETKKDDGWGKMVKASGLSDRELIEAVMKIQQEAEGVEVAPPPPPGKDTVYLDLDM